MKILIFDQMKLHPEVEVKAEVAQKQLHHQVRRLDHFQVYYRRKIPRTFMILNMFLEEKTPSQKSNDYNFSIDQS